MPLWFRTGLAAGAPEPTEEAEEADESMVPMRYVHRRQAEAKAKHFRSKKFCEAFFGVFFFMTSEFVNFLRYDHLTSMKLIIDPIKSRATTFIV